MIFYFIVTYTTFDTYYCQLNGGIMFFGILL